MSCLQSHGLRSGDSLTYRSPPRGLVLIQPALSVQKSQSSVAPKFPPQVDSQGWAWSGEDGHGTRVAGRPPTSSPIASVNNSSLSAICSCPSDTNVSEFPFRFCMGCTGRHEHICHTRTQKWLKPSSGLEPCLGCCMHLVAYREAVSMNQTVTI